MEQHQVAQHQQQPSSCSRSTTCLIYANRHIPKFLALFAESEDNVDERGNKGDDGTAAVQVVTDGATLTAANLLGRSSSSSSRLSLHRPIWIVDSAESIGMKLPPPPPRASRQNNNPHAVAQKMMTVRDIADLVGHALPVAVIDVEHQEELEGWTWADMIDYFEDEERLAAVVPKEISMVENNGRPPPPAAAATTATTNTTRTTSNSRSNREHVRRQASVDFLNRTRHRVLNQISFEFSHCTELRRLVRSPQFVRDLDWIDRAWPRPSSNNEPQQPQQGRAYYPYPKVQYYCLTSAAGCYTDFHIDFGGSSVWYHVLKGSKIFCLFHPPKRI